MILDSKLDIAKLARNSGLAFLATVLGCVFGVGQAEAQLYRFIGVGDSITVGHGDGIICPDPEGTAGYPPRVRQRLSAMGLSSESLTEGVCGETTAEGLTRIDTVLADFVIGASFDQVIVLMEGTNDISQRIGFETSATNVKNMAVKVVEAGAVPLISSVIPRGPEVEVDPGNGKTRTYSLALAEKATEIGVPFVDPFAEFFARPDFFERWYFDDLHPNPSGYSALADVLAPAVFDAFDFDPPLICEQSHEPCRADERTLCLNDERFRVEVDWRTPGGLEGVGTSVPQTDDTGAFWFFSSDNIELLVKILDGRSFNDHFWVFYGGLSDVEYTITVTDTIGDVCKEYVNPQGTQSSVGDTFAFSEQQN